MTTPRLGPDTPSKLYLGSDTPSKFYLGGDVIYTAGVAPPPPMGETPAQAAARVMAVLATGNGSFVDCTFSDHNFRKFQNGIDGTLHTVFPADMFTNNGIFRMFRLRVSGNPVSINLWRGNGSTFDYSPSAQPLISTNNFYVINCTDGEWAAWPVSESQTLTTNSIAFTAASVDAANVRTNVDSIASETAFVDGMDLKRVVFGFSDNVTYEPFE